MKKGIQIKPQSQFPYIEEYRKRFPITKDAIFVYKENIYAENKEQIPYDVIHHEIRHVQQQKETGADLWIDRYLNDKDFRLEQELDAYRYQLQKVKEQNDRAEYLNILTECINNISSPLYGNMISYREAEKLLKQKLPSKAV